MRGSVSAPETPLPGRGNASRAVSSCYNNLFVKTCRNFENTFVLVPHRTVRDSREPASCDSKGLTN